MKLTWPTKKLREICEEIISGDWGSEKEKTGSVLCKVIRGTDFILAQRGELSELPDRYIDIEKFEKIKLKQGDILIEISGGSKDQPTGRILFWDRNHTIPIVFSNFVKKILLNTGIIEPKFFFRYWQFLYFKGITKNYEDRTTNIRNFKLKEFLENEEIPIPPLPIQQKIVKILDTIQGAVEIQEKIIEKTKELKKSLMAELFKYGAPSFRKGRKLKKTEIGEIPDDWEVVRLGEVVKLSNGTRPEFDEEGVFSVYGANGIMGKSKKFLVDSEYILIIGRVGASGEIHLANGKIWISDNALYSSEVKKEKVYLPFLKDYLIWRNLKQFAERSTHPIITQTFLKNFPIPLPPFSEQQEIAEILQTIDQKIEIEKKKKELYHQLFKTLLNKIMSQEIDINLLDY
jgi:type I restriction enzyme S subunit